MTNEIAERCGLATHRVSDQIARLRAAGIVIAPRGKLCETPEQFLADRTERILDFGICLLHRTAASLLATVN